MMYAAEFLFTLMVQFGRKGELLRAQGEMTGLTYFMLSTNKGWIRVSTNRKEYEITDEGIKKIQQELGHERTE